MSAYTGHDIPDQSEARTSTDVSLRTLQAQDFTGSYLPPHIEGSLPSSFPAVPSSIRYGPQGPEWDQSLYCSRKPFNDLQDSYCLPEIRHDSSHNSGRPLQAQYLTQSNNYSQLGIRYDGFHNPGDSLQAHYPAQPNHYSQPEIRFDGFHNPGNSLQVQYLTQPNHYSQPEIRYDGFHNPGNSLQVQYLTQPNHYSQPEIRYDGFHNPGDPLQAQYLAQSSHYNQQENYKQSLPMQNGDHGSYVLQHFEMVPVPASNGLQCRWPHCPLGPGGCKEMIFTRKFELERHMLKHTAPDRFKCSAINCRKHFPRADKLKAHVQAGHDDDTLFACPQLSHGSSPAIQAPLYCVVLSVEVTTPLGAVLHCIPPRYFKIGTSNRIGISSR
ncbi:hypothetical protein K469DRAFT_756271 [Zopfia rhizophila CBS 207.26]|uniref:C2H2-type domain-containing protein n=1 Tax=Zopfia rhizophila CBS 207.26 TaxID=1314779 RepID=A0A6A6DAQ2_9PEZI|nr:hypothetical protein K469DRAFT_756271 [Zopfia rhizophila CBS 207.26]